MGSRWLVAAVLWDAASRICSIWLVVFLWIAVKFFSMHLMLHLHSSMDTTTAWKKLYFSLLVRSDFHMTDSLSIPDQLVASETASYLQEMTLISNKPRHWSHRSWRPESRATRVEGDQKAPFSIATTPRCRGGRYSFLWIAPLYPWCVPYIAEC